MQHTAATDFRNESWQGTPQFHRSVDVRYRGQGYELNIPLTPNLLQDFQREHIRRYGYTHPTREVELVTLRLRATLENKTHVGTAAIGCPIRVKLGSVSEVLFDGNNLKTTIHPRESLHPRRKYSGPAIITEYSATTVIPPKAIFNLDKSANLIISPGSPRRVKLGRIR
jgi:N-methylhydantoinase A